MFTYDFFKFISEVDNKIKFHDNNNYMSNNYHHVTQSNGKA